MSIARSVFTEAIEDHLALKKQNVGIETVMPLARYDVGDPLDRYPGGANRGLDAATVMAPADAPIDTPAVSAEPTQVLVGPSPEQAMEAATALEPAFADRPFEPLTGMAPMLSLVEDIDDEDETPGQPFAPANADVLRFPGGVGPREDAAADALPVEMHGFDKPVATPSATVTDAIAPGAAQLGHEAPTGEQPVIVIDTDEPLVSSGAWADEPAAASRSRSRTKPRFFGLGRKKGADREPAEGWFTDGPRDFNWD
ncbi:MAG: hypothetical protein JWM98_528 [Thermoleophilia bacterium]|nr:hypothetical protein [Thermoleophilia bacterium]